MPRSQVYTCGGYGMLWVPVWKFCILSFHAHYKKMPKFQVYTGAGMVCFGCRYAFGSGRGCRWAVVELRDFWRAVYAGIISFLQLHRRWATFLLLNRSVSTAAETENCSTRGRWHHGSCSRRLRTLQLPSSVRRLLSRCSRWIWALSGHSNSITIKKYSLWTSFFSRVSWIHIYIYMYIYIYI